MAILLTFDRDGPNGNFPCISPLPTLRYLGEDGPGQGTLNRRGKKTHSKLRLGTIANLMECGLILCWGKERQGN